jgi:hypothetical protein
MAASDFTIADVLAWARTKPADEKYDYSDSGNCALCQFLRETFRAASPSVRPYMPGETVGGGWREAGRDRVPYPQELESALRADGAYDIPLDEQWAFGELVERLEALLPPVSDTWAKPDAYLTDIEDVARERVSA